MSKLFVIACLSFLVNATAQMRAVASAASATLPSAGLQFVPMTPCRVVDTRTANGSFGGPELGTGTSREFDLPEGPCPIPTSAVAYSLNVTAVPNGPLGYLTIWPSGQSQPLVSTLNSDGRVKANAAITPAGTNGGVSVFVTNTSHVILDIDGYFVPAGTASALAFYPVPPCRVVDTRNANGALGGPSLAANTSRDFPVQSSNCDIPVTAQAYSVNVTAIPIGPLGYLTLWPSGEPQPLVSTLNSLTGAISANAALVPAGSDGGVSVYVSSESDVVLDVNGYFAPTGEGGLALYTTTPCRVLDTRTSSGLFSGVLTVGVESSACAPPSTAQAYVLNATVVPPSPLDYLTLWPSGSNEPYVSTLNANDGATTSNMAVVPTVSGSIDAYAPSPTQLILDLAGYFAPGPSPSPYVEFVGDDISIGLVAYANNEQWKCTDCASGATSGQLLAALPLAIANKPDLVHILVGSYDVDANPWSLPCNGGPNDPGQDTCVNLQIMEAQLTAAKIPYVLGNVPPWQAGTLSDQLTSSIEGIDGNIFFYDRTLENVPAGVETPIVDYYDALTASYISSNGIDPTPQGYAVMLTLAQAAIAQVPATESK
jgi:hypothetical protein